MRLGRLSHFAVRQVHEHLAEWEAQGENDRLTLLEGRINMSVDDVLAAYDMNPTRVEQDIVIEGIALDDTNDAGRGDEDDADHPQRVASLDPFPDDAVEVPPTPRPDAADIDPIKDLLGPDFDSEVLSR